MVVSVIPIGNSRGIRLPKAVLDQLEITDAVDLEVEGKSIILKATGKPRSGWEEAFAEMSGRGDDALLVTEPDPDGDLEWEW